MFGLMRKSTHDKHVSRLREMEERTYAEWQSMLDKREEARRELKIMELQLTNVLSLLAGHKGTTIGVKRVENALADLPRPRSRKPVPVQIVGETFPAEVAKKISRATALNNRHQGRSA